MPYSTLKYLQQKDRNQVPAGTSAPVLVRALVPIRQFDCTHKDTRFDMASFRPLEFSLVTPRIEAR